MKSTLTAMAATLIVVAPAYAVDEHHPEQKTAAAQAPEKAVDKMQQNATKMQVQLDRIAQATDPQERQKLLMEHMQTMRENMMLGQQMAMGGNVDCPMHGMMGGGMGMMGSGGMMGHGGQGPGHHDAMVERMQQMERRMEMMERQLGTTKPRPPQTR